MNKKSNTPRPGWVSLITSLMIATVSHSIVASELPNDNMNWLKFGTGAEWSTDGYSENVVERLQCRQDFDRFMRDVGDLILTLDGIPDYLREVGWALPQTGLDFTEEQLLLACEAMRMAGGQNLPIRQLVDANLDREELSCFTTQTALILIAVRTVLDALAGAGQALCDFSSCGLPPPAPPAQCNIKCLAPVPFYLASEVISLRLDNNDKCSNFDHEQLMSGFRSGLENTLSALVLNTGTLAANVTAAHQSAATSEDLSDTEELINEGFDGEGGRDALAIGPAFESLLIGIDQAQADRRDFEDSALHSRLETALVSGATLSRMIRPRSFGGLLEEVRELVASRIQAFLASGADVEVALADFRQGDQAFNQAEYGPSLEFYRSAYLSLTREPKALEE